MCSAELAYNKWRLYERGTCIGLISSSSCIRSGTRLTSGKTQRYYSLYEIGKDVLGYNVV